MAKRDWMHISTAPFDGSIIWAIEPSSLGVFKMYYATCCFWAEDGGDLWPSHPSHWQRYTPVRPEHPGEEFYKLPHIKEPWRSNIDDPEPVKRS